MDIRSEVELAAERLRLANEDVQSTNLIAEAARQQMEAAEETVKRAQIELVKARRISTEAWQNHSSANSRMWAEKHEVARLVGAKPNGGEPLLDFN